jgi:hypothetical protein
MNSLAAVLDLAFQAGPPFDPSRVDPAVGLGSGGVGTFLSTLVVGALLFVFAPKWTRGRMHRVGHDPFGSLVYGLVALVLAGVVVFLLFITIIGVFVAVPLAIVLYLVWVVGAVIASLAIADQFVDVDDDWVVALVVAAALNGVLTVTGIGGLVSFCIGAAGFGTLLRD